MASYAFPFDTIISVPSAAILGRNDSGVGSAEALTADEVRSLLSVYTTSQVDSLLSGKSNTGHTHTTSDITSGTFDISRIPLGSSSTTVCVGNDSRLSDARAPLAHTHTTSDIISGTFDISRIPIGSSSSTVCAGNDSRLSDARAPLAHTHTPADITGFGEAVDDEVAALLTAGTGISLVYDDNANTLTISSTSGGGGSGSNIQTFSSSGTWTKPSGYSRAIIVLIGGGGGGGSGQRGATTTQRAGGGGGAAGQITKVELALAALGSTESVTIGAGGTGGAAAASDSSNGSAGSVGGTTQFGSICKALGGQQGQGGAAGLGGSGGLGRNVVFAEVRLASITAGCPGTQGSGATSPSSATAVIPTPTGGGGGGGITNTNSVVNSTSGTGLSSGGDFFVSNVSGASTVGNNGATGQSYNIGLTTYGLGGGGGKASTTSAGGTGGTGGAYGGGGGGGGASSNGFTSGAGGTGGGGYCLVICY